MARLESAGDRLDPTPSSRLMGPDGLFEPDVTVVLPAMGDPTELAGALDAVEAVLRDRRELGEVIVCAFAGSDASRRARGLGAVVVPTDADGPRRFATGLGRARGSIVAVLTDPDRYSLGDLRALLEGIDGGLDLVIGNRFQGPTGGTTARDRWVVAPLLRTVMGVFYGLWAGDPGCGFLAMRNPVGPGIGRLSGPSTPLEWLLEAVALRYRIGEVPVTYTTDSGAGPSPSVRSALAFAALNTSADVYAVPASVGVLVGLGALAASALRLLPAVSGGVVGLDVRASLAGSALSLLSMTLLAFGVYARAATPPWRRPWEPVVARLASGRSLRAGVYLGVVTTGLAVGAAGQLALVWLRAGFRVGPAIRTDLLVLTAVVIGSSVAFWSVVIARTRHD